MSNPIPHNLEIEQAVLGSLLVYHESVPRIAAILRPEHFSEPLHARIMDTIRRDFQAGGTTTALTLLPRFQNDATMIELGGCNKFVSRLTANAARIIGLESLARQIRELAERRRIIRECEILVELAGNTNGKIDHRKAAAVTITELSNMLSDHAQRKTAFTIGEAADEVLIQVDRIKSGEPNTNSIPTGIGPLDEKVGGLSRGSYNILAGRPSMGKTAFGVQLALNLSEAGHGVAYFSLEMPAIAISERCIAAQFYRLYTDNVSYRDISHGVLDDQEVARVRKARDYLKNLPFVIDERPALAVSEVEAQARVFQSRFERQGKRLDLILVDHLHKCIAPGYSKPVEVYTQVSARLADLAKTLNCPVVALAQLNRNVENRDDKRPTLSDLRESGSIEQDADLVMFAYRESYYLERRSSRNRDDEVRRMEELANNLHKFELIVSKNRQGPIGTVDLWADMACNVVGNPIEKIKFRKPA